MSTKSSNSNLAARSWMSCLGLMCILMGSLFVWYLWTAYKKATLTDSWVETPAAITSSTIDTSQLTQHYTMKYRLDLTYDYEVGGKTFTGTKIRRLPTESGDLQKVKKKKPPTLLAPR